MPNSDEDSSQSTTQDEETLTIKEVKKLSGFSKITLYRKLKAGLLKGSKPAGSNQWRIKPTDLNEFLNGPHASP